MEEQNSNVAANGIYRDKKEKAIVVLLESLDYNTKAEKAVSEFTATELNSDGGMELLIAKPDSVFKSETIDEAYETCSKFINFSRQENNDMGDSKNEI